MSENGVDQRQFRITGRVQGVGFRWWVTQRAGQLGVTGTVRNCADGSVEVRVGGPSEQIETLKDMLADGPSSAHVRDVEEVPPDDSELPDEFRIAR